MTEAVTPENNPTLAVHRAADSFGFKLTSLESAVIAEAALKAAGLPRQKYNPDDKKLKRIYQNARMGAVEVIPRPYPGGTPEEEQEIQPWQDWHEAVLLYSLRAVYEAGRVDGS